MHRREAAERVAFDDRTVAGKALGEAMVKQSIEVSVVLGLTRGGVPVAFQVAAKLGLPMDIIVVKKLRAPISEELAIGAVCADGARVLREETIRELGVASGYVAHETQVRLREAQEAERRYRGERAALDLTKAAVAIVDDGMATGATMEAAVLSARRRGADKVTVVVPVGSSQACEALAQVADEVFCLSTPADFWAVGQFYGYFPQVSDEEVRRLLEESRGVSQVRTTAQS